MNSCDPLNENENENYFDNNKTMHNDFLLIINSLHNVIYADQNGLKLWNVTDPDMIPRVNFTSAPFNMSHTGTTSTKLVLHENKVIDVIIEKLDFNEVVTNSQDPIYMIRSVKKKNIDMASEISQKLAEKLPLQILLAEDNLINIKLITLLLNKMGYFPDTSMNGAEAMMMLEKKHYDILFMDVQMPVMDGLEATRKIISTWSKNMRPYIIAMTANVMHGDREKCLVAGMDDYMSKPIRFNEIEDVLMKWGSV